MSLEGVYLTKTSDKNAEPVTPATADVSFTDLFDVAEIQQIQDAFAAATNVASIITHPDGTPITRPSRFCRLCKDIIRQTQKGLANCLRSDAVIGRQNATGPIIQPCLSGGLWDAGASITAGGKHIANWLIGQVKNEAIDEDRMIRYASEIGADEDEFRRALQEVPVMSIEQFRKVAQVLFLLANELSLKAYQHVKQARLSAERKQAAEALQKAHALLERRVEERTAELKDANRKLAQEIDEHKRAQEEISNAHRRLDTTNKFLTTVFSAIPIPVFAKDKQGRYIQVNNAWADLLGHTPEFYKGKTVMELWPSRWSEVYHQKDLELMNNPEKQVYEFEVVDKNGAVHRAIWSKHVFRDENGDVAGLVGAFQDITDRVRTEQELRAAREKLEERVKERTAELQQRSRQLAALAMDLSTAEDRERRRLAEVLHDDLQQMLVALQFQLDVLAKRTKPQDSLRKMFDNVGDLLQTCVDRTRTLSHELSPPTLGQRGLVSALQWQAQRMQDHHGLQVEIDADGDAEPRTEALRLFLFKAVRELLFNVVKHAKVTQATVKLRRAKGRLHVTVQDQGKGFDPDTLSADEAPKGFGLLGIRERVGWLGGFLKVHSEPGQGSRFVLGVPDAQLQGHTKNSIKKMAEKATKPKTPGKKARSVVRVVLADDHWSVREGLARLLEEEPDVQVVGEADNGKQAVDLVQQLHPDIVVMDVSMPVMNGVDATCLIKRQFPGVRIVALSMFEQDDVAQSMIDAGAEAYLRKSGPSEELLRAIRGTTV